MKPVQGGNLMRNNMRDVSEMWCAGSIGVGGLHYLEPARRKQRDLDLRE